MCQKLVAVLKQTPKLLAKLNKTIIHEYPELEDLEVTPSVEEQKFKSNKYGYNEVTVKAVNIEDLGIEEFVIDKNVLNQFSENTIVMHPLPRVNEITVDIDDDERAVYFEQAHNGMWVRMALLLKVFEE